MPSVHQVMAVVSILLTGGQSYVLSADCDPFADDIVEAMSDAIQSAGTAQYSLNPALGGRVTVADWFGLMNSMFPGVMDGETPGYGRYIRAGCSLPTGRVPHS